MFSLVGCKFWGVSVIVFIFTLIEYYNYEVLININVISHSLIDCIPTLMGFIIAGMAIIMGSSEKILNRLSEEANDGEIPLRVIIANFSICLLFLTILFLLVLINIGIQMIDCSHKIVGFLIVFFTLEFVLSIINVILHLFSTSTHLFR